MILSEKQTIFSQHIARLILKAHDMGYGVTLGEAWRSDETAALNAKEGKGIKNSLHRERLAMDLNLFKNGIFLTSKEDYEPLGAAWEAMSDPMGDYTCYWGGRFSKPDSDHFSIGDGGFK